jgi:hypothetical protein
MWLSTRKLRRELGKRNDDHQERDQPIPRNPAGGDRVSLGNHQIYHEMGSKE